MPEVLTMPSLTHAVWVSSADATGTREQVLAEVGSCGAVAGIAYTTAGARAIMSVDEGLLHSSEGVVDGETVYELRLWRTDVVEGGDLLAQEWRWVNGSGSAAITLRPASWEPDGGGEPEPCWYRPNQYLQHGATLPDAPRTMTSVEVFTEEEYGNVVFRDELMTGRWEGSHA